MLLLLALLQAWTSSSVPLHHFSYSRQSYCGGGSFVPAYRHHEASRKQSQASWKYESFHHKSMSKCLKVSSSSHALSTTLPWTIRLSLAVLWGVCWMFYPADNLDGRVNSGDEQYSIDWDQIQQSYQEDIGLETAQMVHSAQPSAMMEASLQDREPVSQHMASSTSSCATFPSRDRHLSTGMEALATWPEGKPELYLQGIHTGLDPRTSLVQSSQPSRLDLYSHQSQISGRGHVSPDTRWSVSGGNRLSSHAPIDALPPVTSSVETATYIRHESQAALGPHGDSRSFYTSRQAVPYAFQPTGSSRNLIAPALSDTHLSPFGDQQFSNLDMVEDISYPISSPSDDYSSRRTSSIDIRMKTEQHTPHDQSPGNRAYPRTFKRDRLPPRNSSDEIFCDHADCTGKREIFTRACEWNKHMDKHERPYKCLERGCERLLGFTYSGGLLRHDREVHKKNLATRTALYCPFPNCNRNPASGHGFTRLENLNEHKRRRHPGEEPPATPNQAASVSPATSGHKRKRTSDSVDEQESESDEASDDETSPVTKRPHTVSDERSQLLLQRLRSDIRQRDEQIVQQHACIESLRNTIQSLQQQQTSMVRGPISGKRG